MPAKKDEKQKVEVVEAVEAPEVEDHGQGPLVVEPVVPDQRHGVPELTEDGVVSEPAHRANQEQA